MKPEAIRTRSSRPAWWAALVLLLLLPGLSWADPPCGCAKTETMAQNLSTPETASPGRDWADRIGVMLQLENILPADGLFGNRSGEVDRQFALLKQAGVRWTRAGIMWEQIQPKPEKWNWSAADKIIESARKNGVQILWLVGNTAPWDSSNGEWNGVPKDLADDNGHFPQFVRQLVTRYKTQVHYWEIRNEPNLDYMWAGHSPEKYARYLTQAYRAIKKADPGAKVVLGGLGGSIEEQTGWFKKLLSNLVGGPTLPFDIVNFHVYPGEADNHGHHGAGAVPRYVEECLTKTELAMKASGLADIPIWFTEVDFPAATKRQPDDPEYRQGDLGQLLFIRNQLPRFVAGDARRKVFWASLLDDYDDPGFESVGLITSDRQHRVGQPRPSFEALGGLLRGRAR